MYTQLRTNHPVVLSRNTAGLREELSRGQHGASNLVIDTKTLNSTPTPNKYTHIYTGNYRGRPW